MRTALKLIQEDIFLHKERIVSNSMSTLQQVQDMYPNPAGCQPRRKRESRHSGLDYRKRLLSHFHLVSWPFLNPLQRARRHGGQRSGKKCVIIVTQRMRLCGRRLSNPLLSTSVWVASTAKEARRRITR